MAKAKATTEAYNDTITPAVVEAWLAHTGGALPDLSADSSLYRDEEDDKLWGIVPMREEPLAMSIAQIPNEAVRNQCNDIQAVFVPLPSKYRGSVRNHVALKQARAVELAMREGEASQALDHLRRVLAAGTSVNHAIARAAGHKQKDKLRTIQKEQNKDAKAAQARYTKIRNLMLALGMEANT